MDSLAYDGGSSLRFIRQQVGGYGIASQFLPAESIPATRVRLSGYFRTLEVNDGSAALWLRIDGADGRSLFFDNMAGRGATGTQEWKRFSILAPLPDGASQLAFGVLIQGTGTAWIDGLRLEPILSAHAPLPDELRTCLARPSYVAVEDRVPKDHPLRHSANRVLRYQRPAHSRTEMVQGSGGSDSSR